MTCYEISEALWQKDINRKNGIDFSEVGNQLKKRKYVSKTEVNNLFVAMNPFINESQARSVVYSLMKENFIYTSGSGDIHRARSTKKGLVPKSRGEEWMRK